MHRQTRSATAIALLLATLPTMTPAAIDADGGEAWATGSIVYIDNDALSVAERDEDYTGGFAVTLAGRRARDGRISADPLLGLVDDWFGVSGGSERYRLHSAQIGAIAFTPADVHIAEPVAGDRPYASLVYWANGRTYLRGAHDAVYQTSISLGVLGLNLLPQFQDGFHGLIGAARPRGWDYQISDGGEPTLRYTVSRQDLAATHRGGGWGDYDLKTTLGGSLGYTTEASAAVSVRWGRLNTPWWSFPPERVNYISEPVPVVGSTGGRRELFVWAGAKLKAPIYNVFLQGQFRDSEVSYDRDDLRELVAEAWLGATAQVAERVRVSWVMRYQTSELRDGRGDRELLWGSLFITRDL
ncbi:MAG: lipid A-modifier LpxR family protein [Sinimarinibacterium flocculans]|uniref:lipid A-modifier LpxR family protein n=1 Tax=Sinimarinibacterium flocculans TaxID=985250 RepID=UPI003C670EB6